MSNEYPKRAGRRAGSNDKAVHGDYFDRLGEENKGKNNDGLFREAKAIFPPSVNPKKLLESDGFNGSAATAIGRGGMWSRLLVSGGPSLRVSPSLSPPLFTKRKKKKKRKRRRRNR